MSTLKSKILLLKELLALKEVIDKGSIQIAESPKVRAFVNFFIDFYNCVFSYLSVWLNHS